MTASVSILRVDFLTCKYRLPPSAYLPGRLLCFTNKAVILSAKLSSLQFTYYRTHVLNPALAGFLRITLAQEVH